MHDAIVYYTPPRYSHFSYADETVIQKAKRVKLLACHPDKVGSSVEGAGHAVLRITSAQAVLGDSRTRARYDAELRASASAAAAAAAHGGNSGGGYAGGPPPRTSKTSLRYPLYPDDPGIMLPTRCMLGRDTRYTLRYALSYTPTTLAPCRRPGGYRLSRWMRPPHAGPAFVRQV